MTTLTVPDLHVPDLHVPDLHVPDVHRPDLHRPDLHWAGLADSAAPWLELTAVALVETGWDSRVLHARAADGSRWIFRFPRRPEVVADMARERLLLALLRRHDLPIAVPDWKIHVLLPSGDGEQLVVGYPELPGFPAGTEPAGDGVFEFAVDLPPPSRYAATLGAAMAALHAVDPGPLPRVTAADLRTESSTILARVQALPVPTVLLRYWQSWIEDDRWWQYATMLRHGDLHPGHTMIDGTGAVVGVIDWTDAGTGDPAMDFIDTRHAFGPAFGDDLLAAYSSAGGLIDSVPGRVVRWQSFAPASAALLGLDHRRPDLVASAIGRLRQQATRLGAGQLPL
ncbi:phosphotransferase [Nakamurella sp. PAMC28650]|uniref:phosphotransferase n=1 Tax=Nakamurella sp. PAMC28650 TaxID=2762325 RepID=UPI00164ECACE|nr:phosphotransferase [Nakamurella sp. PAMC28650]QNK81734.1 phosphotransferase [Nakamurella sp. PAMC28650]